MGWNSGGQVAKYKDTRESNERLRSRAARPTKCTTGADAKNWERGKQGGGDKRTRGPEGRRADGDDGEGRAYIVGDRAEGDGMGNSRFGGERTWGKGAAKIREWKSDRGQIWDGVCRYEEPGLAGGQG